MRLGTVLLVFFLLTNTAYSAESLIVEKVVNTTNLTIGDNISIWLNFVNPFEKEIKIKIVDKNIVGGNGIEVKCMEYVLTGKNTSTFYYPSIQVFVSGNYTLDSAEVRYVNPKTGRDEVVKSNQVNISVYGSVTQKIKKITTIYQCNGFNIRTTSFSSFGSLIQKREKQENQTQNKIIVPKKQETTSKKRDYSIWIILIILLIILTALYIKKHKHEGKIMKKVKTKKETNKSIMKKMIIEAKNLFNKGEEKEAYEKMSHILRLYYANKLGIKREITNKELLKILSRKKPKNYKDVKKCIEVCNLVQFAKHKTNKKEFEQIIKVVEELIF